MKNQDSERQEFRHLMYRHRQKLLQVATGILRDATEAEDIVQEAMIKAYRWLPRFRGESTRGTWLYRITTNLCLDHLRRRGPRLLREAATLEDGAGHLVTRDPADDPERRAFASGIMDRVEEAMRRLSPTERTVFVLRMQRGLSIRETSEVMERSEGTIKNLLFRATRKLREDLADLRNQETAS